jgi:chromosomal replication initiation ATPase DnaA
MEHVIHAKYGDKIIIHIPAKPKVARQQIITIQPHQALTQSHYEIVNNVCAALNITIEQLQGKRGNTYLTAARFYISYELHVNHNITLKEIGRLLNRDHTSIINAVKQYKELTSVNDALMMQITQQIQGYEAS